MVKKLHFKGDPVKKKKKATTGGVKKEESVSLNEPTDSTAWVRATDSTHINGPTVLLHSQGPSVLNFHSTLSKPHMHSVNESIEDFKPSDVASVWVASRLSGTDTITLRSPDGKFLAADKHGGVSAMNEARGPNEQWRPIIQQDSSIAWMSIYDKFLSLDEVAGGNIVLRADSDAVGFGETWSVKVQAKYKYEGEREKLRQAKKLSDAGGIDISLDDEEHHTSRFQAYGKAAETTASDRKNLSKAKQEGKLNEALLDKRSKTKSDKFC